MPHPPRLRPGRSVRSSRPSCTCPMQFDCKHTVATLLASNRLAASHATPASRSRRRGGRCWRRRAADGPPRPTTALALGVELRQRIRRGASSWAPVRVESASARGLHQFGADVLVGLRPLERSARTRRLDQGHRLVGCAPPPGTRLRDRAGALVHRAAQHRPRHAPLRVVLRRIRVAHARRRRVAPAVAAPRGRRRPRDRAWCRRRSTRASHSRATPPSSCAPSARPGGSSSRPRLSIDGEDVDVDAVRPIGHVGVYRFEVRRERIELTLAPLSAARPRARARSPRGPPVAVPASDADEFLREHLPRIVRHVAVEAPGIDLPAGRAPRR